jgi:pimeloyl-ACP methyl ester carboxylesterase
MLASARRVRLPLGAMASAGDGLGTPTRWVGVNGIRVHCLTAGGAGSPVVLLHGGGIDSASFIYGHRTLAEGHRAFAPDWPGYGQSDKPDLDYATGLLRRLPGTLDGRPRPQKGQPRLGISIGGGAALGFALSSPQRVGKLVLVDNYGLGSEVPWGRLGSPIVRAPLVDKLAYALLRRSRTMIRWSLYALVHDRRMVTEGMVEQTARLLEDPRQGWRGPPSRRTRYDVAV